MKRCQMGFLYFLMTLRSTSVRLSTADVQRLEHVAVDVLRREHAVLIDHIACLLYTSDEGRVAGIGTHEELLKTCETYREIAQSQLSKEELA